MKVSENDVFRVPIDDTNADTEWNDILRKHGIIPEKPTSPTREIEEAILERKNLAHEERLEGKLLDELDELEDSEDESFLQKYRQQRINEIAKLTKKSLHGAVYHITKSEYSREVTAASAGTTVLVLLTGVNMESRVLLELWHQAAREYSEIKFCEIRADMAVEAYPDRNCPTILIYRETEIVTQVVTLASLGGLKVGMMQVGKLLLEVGAIEENDSRLTSVKKGDNQSTYREVNNISKASWRMNRDKNWKNDDTYD